MFELESSYFDITSRFWRFYRMWYLGYHGFEAITRLSTGRNGMRTYDMVRVHTDCPSTSQEFHPAAVPGRFKVGSSFDTFIQYLESKSGWKPTPPAKERPELRAAC